MFLQYAVDPLPDTQLEFFGFDMDVRGIDLDRVGKHGLDEFNDRRIRRVRVDREFSDIDLAVAKLPFDFCRQRIDLFLAAIHAVDRAQQVGLVDECYAHWFFQQPAQLVIGVYVAGIGHADQQPFVVRLQHQRPMSARLRLFEQQDRFLTQIRIAEIDKIDMHVLGETAV